MILIACLDDNGGMMFNARRQSKDRLLREHMLRACDGITLWMSPYSAAQFKPNAPVQGDEHYAQLVKETDACFVEDGEFPQSTPDTLLLYRWNRRYPADRVFPRQLLESRGCTQVEEFPGYSHETITQEVHTL